MHISRLASVGLAAAGGALAGEWDDEGCGHAIVVNKCPYDVYLWSIASYDKDGPYKLGCGMEYTETFTKKSGVALEVKKEGSEWCDDKLVLYYKLAHGKVFYDLFSKGDYAVDGKAVLEPEDEYCPKIELEGHPHDDDNYKKPPYEKEPPYKDPYKPPYGPPGGGYPPSPPGHGYPPSKREDGNATISSANGNPKCCQDESDLVLYLCAEGYQPPPKDKYPPPPDDRYPRPPKYPYPPPPDDKYPYPPPPDDKYPYPPPPDDKYPYPPPPDDKYPPPHDKYPQPPGRYPPPYPPTKRDVADTQWDEDKPVWDTDPKCTNCGLREKGSVAMIDLETLDDSE